MLSSPPQSPPLLVGYWRNGMERHYLVLFLLRALIACLPAVRTYGRTDGSQEIRNELPAFSTVRRRGGFLRFVLRRKIFINKNSGIVIKISTTSSLDASPPKFRSK